MKSPMIAPTVDDIGTVQTIRKISLALTIAAITVAFIVSATRWQHAVHEAIEWAGLLLIAISIGGRTWCSLYIGGRKTSELVTMGPYSICRNPLYVFSIIGAIGVGAQLGAVTVALLAGLVAWIIHILVVRKEERLLFAEHGEAYRQYMADVPRFIPRFSRWKDVDLLQVRPRSVIITFLDACFLLVAIPVAETIEYLQNAGVIHVFFHLP